LGFISLKTNQQTISGATKLVDATCREYANLSRVTLTTYMNTALFLKQVFENTGAIPEKERRNYLAQTLKNTLTGNQDILSTWSILEHNAVDTLHNQYKNMVGSTILGNFRHIYYRWNNQIVLSNFVEQNPNEVFSGKIYNSVKEKNAPVVIEPYYYSYTNRDEDKILQANMVVPLHKKGAFMGVVGIDVPLESFEKVLKNVKPFPQSFAFLVSNKGFIVSHPDRKLIGKRIDQIGLADNADYHYVKHIETGVPISFLTTASEMYVTFSPINIGSSSQPWALGMVASIKVITQRDRQNILLSIIVGLLGLILISFSSYLIINRITSPLKKTTEVLANLSLGIFEENQKLVPKNEDELSEVAIAVNTLIDGMIHTSKFALEIGKGNLETEFHLRSDRDTLGNALIDMRKNIKEARKKEIEQKKIDERNQWSANGINKMGEILRQNNQNIEDLSYAALKYLIDYMGAVQGAIYIKNDDNPKHIYYDLSSAIAYGREKLIDCKIKPEEGLVGRCASEELTIYLTEIPDNYPRIKSGLGGASPKVVIVVPMKSNEEMLGVIELISFKYFEEFEIEFIEKVGEDMASTIANVRTNQKTARLLKQSQQQSEELASKEEQMRQTIEEMNATQEEAQTRYQQISSLVDAVNQVSMVAEFDTNGHITEINENFLRLLGVNRQQMIGRKQGSFEKELNKFENETMWRKLRQGSTVTKTQTIDVGFKTILLSETYVPVKDNYGKIVKVINIATDISHSVDNKE
jgi:PAS domain S-box-containing protein